MRRRAKYGSPKTHLVRKTCPFVCVCTRPGYRSRSVARHAKNAYPHTSEDVGRFVGRPKTDENINTYFDAKQIPGCDLIHVVRTKQPCPAQKFQLHRTLQAPPPGNVDALYESKTIRSINDVNVGHKKSRQKSWGHEHPPSVSAPGYPVFSYALLRTILSPYPSLLKTSTQYTHPTRTLPQNL